MKNPASHKYLLSLYHRVDDLLSGDVSEGNLPDLVVSFCTITEKILKIKLHNKNPLLVFDTSYLRDNISFSIAALKKEKDTKTAKIDDIIERFEIVFKKGLRSGEFQALRDVYKVRNNFVHGYKPDNEIDFDIDDITKKMSTIWLKVSKIAVTLFGKENIKTPKPKKTYTEEELEKILEEEVRKMISANPVGDLYQFVVTGSSAYQNFIQEPTNAYFDYTIGAGDRCPRCGSYSFLLDGGPSDIFIETLSTMRPRLYKCKKCHLELTEKQYEIAKRIKGSIF